MRLLGNVLFNAVIGVLSMFALWCCFVLFCFVGGVAAKPPTTEPFLVMLGFGAFLGVIVGSFGD